MIERMELGEFYKELRLARKLKQSDVACDGLTASQLSKFELGQSMLSADKLILAIQGINVTFDELGTNSTTIKNLHICDLAERLWIALPTKISLA